MTNVDLDNTMQRLKEASLNWKPRDNPQWNTAPTHTTVSRQDLQQIDDMLTEYYNKSLEDKNVIISNVRDMLHKMLDTGVTDEDRAWADKEIEKHLERKPLMIEFGDIELTKAQITKMGKTLWDDCGDSAYHKWRELTDRDRESFIKEFIIPIPKVLAAIGLRPRSHPLGVAEK